MTTRDWLGRVEEFATIPAPAALRPKPPRRTRGPTVAACAVLLLLCSMCLRSSWDGSGVLAMTTQEQRDALTLPPSMVSEEKRRAVVARIQIEIRDRIRILQAIAEEDSKAGRDAKLAIENTRSVLGD